jgi:hypothetical protein
MPQTLKILGQSAPAATTETDLYTVPASTSAVISTITICNRDSSNAYFRVSVSEDGAATSNKDYVYYDVIIGGNDTFASTLGISLSATDKVRIYASTANLSFNLFGQENS